MMMKVFKTFSGRIYGSSVITLEICFRITRGFAVFHRLPKASISIQECDYHSHNTYESSKRPMKTLKYAKTLNKSLNRSLKK